MDEKKINKDHPPVEHIKGTLNFTCVCGTKVTFTRAPNSVTWKVLRYLEQIARGVWRGRCPDCDCLHWKGHAELL